MNGKNRARLLSAVIVLALIAAWELFARHGGIDQLLIAGPFDVLRAFNDDASLLATNTWVTVREALFGIGLAIVFGVLVGIVLHLSPILHGAVYPLLISSQSIPLVVIAPLLVIAFGFGILPKVLIVVLVCFFPIAAGTIQGLRATDPELLQLMRSLGAGRLRTLRMVELPAALPQMFTGMKVAVTWSFIGAVFGEYAGSSEGLGYLIARGTPMFETARVYAAIVILASLSLALYGLTSLIERRVAPWSRRPA